MLDTSESWAGWAWSLVPSILPTSWEEEWNQQRQSSPPGHTVHIGIYVDYASLTFKVCTLFNVKVIILLIENLRYPKQVTKEVPITLNVK